MSKPEELKHHARTFVLELARSSVVRSTEPTAKGELIPTKQNRQECVEGSTRTIFFVAEEHFNECDTGFLSSVSSCLPRMASPQMSNVLFTQFLGVFGARKRSFSSACVHDVEHHATRDAPSVK